MTKAFMKASLMLSLPLAVVLATPPSHAGIWRSSEEASPTKKATTTKQAATAKPKSGTKAIAPKKTLAGTKLTASAKPAPTTKTAATAKASATAKGGATTATKPETSIGTDGQVVYHSVSDWQPGSLNRQSSRTSAADPRGGPRTRDGKSRERAVEVALSSVQP